VFVFELDVLKSSAFQLWKRKLHLYKDHLKNFKTLVILFNMFFSWKNAFNSEEIESSNGFFSLQQSKTSSKLTNLW